jgi:hypothetical protein
VKVAPAAAGVFVGNQSLAFLLTSPAAPIADGATGANHQREMGVRRRADSIGLDVAQIGHDHFDVEHLRMLR